MKVLNIVLLFAATAFCGNVNQSEEWHNSGNVVHGNNSYQVTNNYMLPTDTVYLTRTITDTVRIVVDSDGNEVEESYLLSSIACQYVADPTNLDEFGVKANAILSTSDNWGGLGVRLGYASLENTHNFEISGLIGHKSIQLIAGWGIYDNTSGMMLGANFVMPTKIGFTASFNNFITDKKYVPEVGVGLSINIGG